MFFEVLVVLGSSLTVMSGLRFVRHNAKRGRPVVIMAGGGALPPLLARLRDLLDLRGTKFGIGVDPADGLLRQGEEVMKKTGNPPEN